MKGFAIPVLVALTLAVSPGNVCAADAAYIEFLWQPAPKGALARGEAFGFVMDPAQHHVVCVEAEDAVTGPSKLRIDVIDASGADVAAYGDGSFLGAKKCNPAKLPPTATPGEWTFNVYVDDVLLGTKTIEVARTLDEAAFHSDPRRPYVLGRPNYDPSIPPDEYVGRLSWIMTVDPAGTVRHVDVEVAEGAGERMKARAVAAGMATMFPPNASPDAKPFKVRQEYLLDSD